MNTVDTNPAISQADRDLIEDLGLPDVLERQPDPPVLAVDEQVAS